MDITPFINPHSRDLEFVIATITLQDANNVELADNVGHEGNAYPIYFPNNGDQTTGLSYAGTSSSAFIDPEGKSDGTSSIPWIGNAVHGQQPQHFQNPNFLENSILLNQPENSQWQIPTFLNTAALPEFSNPAPPTTIPSGVIWPDNHTFM